MQLVIPLWNRRAEKTKPTLKAIICLRHRMNLELTAPRCSDALFFQHLASSGQTLSQLICASVRAHGTCMEVKCYQTLVRCIIPIKANGKDILQVSVCTCPDANLWCCLWWCRGFAMPNTCHVKCYYIPMLTCLSLIVILLKCCTRPFPTSPAIFLFSTTTCVICTTSVLQGCHTPLFIHPLFNSIWQCFYFL